MRAIIKNFIGKFFTWAYFIKEWKGETKEPTNSYRLVFFSHYDSKGLIHDYVIHYLKELQLEKGLIIFITTSPFLEESAVEKIKPYCHRVLLRKKIGLDFGSWRMAFDRYSNLLKHASALMLVNDSCFGPLFGLSEILSDFEKKNTVSGITLNAEVSPHLQSYFLFIPADVFKHKFFKKFIKRVVYRTNKERIIYDYEIGFSTEAIKNGLILNAWVNNEHLERTYQGVDGERNITVWYGDLLIEKGFSPFIKKAIFTNSKELVTGQSDRIMLYLRQNNSAYATLINDYFKEKE